MHALLQILNRLSYDVLHFGMIFSDSLIDHLARDLLTFLFDVNGTNLACRRLEGVHDTVVHFLELLLSIFGLF